MLRFHLLQYGSKLGDVDYNLDRLIKAMDELCVGDGTDVIVTPELYLPGYMSKDMFFQIAEPIDGKTIGRLVREASKRNCHVITGFAERDPETHVLYNSAVAVGPEGVLAVYRKRHLPSYGVFDEYRYFGIGKGDIPVININGHRVGIAICYDAFYPEVSRVMMLRGAEVHVYISAAPDMSRLHFETFMIARALENVAYTVYVNTVGQYDGLGFFGGSHVVNPLGSVLVKAKYYEEDVKTVEIDPSDIVNYRSHRPILKDLDPTDIELVVRSLEEHLKPRLPRAEEVKGKEAIVVNK
ncbi:carbon-nitrogen hydrolase family protein [Vulcanisaeta thermophila]|uniref:carbon-nitrogen hydrolase family protein n=1 Tax=Vulcanisaeta thermophila TaxID=867917 RepID=UPI0008534FB8|nr:carbon-nitrogen hydrolase family protein [Vulcanisaeta thermophila]